MQCNESRDHLMQEPVDPSVQEQLTRHLSECASCRSIKAQRDHLQKTFGQWKDEPVPAWSKPHGDPSFSPKQSPLLTWLPLAACLALFFLVAARVTITKNEQGFHVSFGGAEVKAAQPETAEPEWKAYVDQAFAKLQTDTNAQFTLVIKTFQEQQNQKLNEFAANLLAHGQRERELLLTNWQAQRAEDLGVFQKQVRVLLARQQRQASNLYALANYVEKTPGPIEKN